jgi:hypothetical protein
MVVTLVGVIAGAGTVTAAGRFVMIGAVAATGGLVVASAVAGGGAFVVSGAVATAEVLVVSGAVAGAGVFVVSSAVAGSGVLVVSGAVAATVMFVAAGVFAVAASSALDTNGQAAPATAINRQTRRVVLRLGLECINICVLNVVSGCLNSAGSLSFSKNFLFVPPTLKTVKPKPPSFSAHLLLKSPVICGSRAVWFHAMMRAGLSRFGCSRRFCAAKTGLFFDVAIVLGGACLGLWRMIRFRRDQRWAEAGSREIISCNTL